MGRHSKPDSGDSLPDREPEPFEAASDEPHEESFQEPSGGSGHEAPAAEPPADTWGAGRFGDEYGEPAADDYPDFGFRPVDAEHPADAEAPAEEPSETAPPPPPFRASHRGLRDWQGGHRSAGGRRGVSIGVIVALVTVVVVVAGVILWQFIGDALSHRSHTAAATCAGGKDAVAVLADPSIADQVKELADGYNKQAGPIGDRCVDVTVKAANSDAVISGFIGKWPSDLGAQPGLWIPGSSISAARLSGAAGQKIISDSRSLVTSPVLLAIRPEFSQPLSKQNWAALPGLQSNPTSMANWGSLRLALPVGGNGDASFLAGEAIAAASAPAGAPPTSGSAAVRTLVSGQPKLPDDSLNEAMNALLKPGSKAEEVAAAPVHAVVTTEQQLFARGQSISDAKSKLGSWTPPGPVPVADYPTVLLSGSWLKQEQTTAASAFARYMHTPEQLAKLAKAGFRVNGVKPPSSPVTGFAALPSTLSVGDDAMRATLADTMATPSTGVAATIMLDQSLPNDDGGGKTRLANVIAALDNRIKALPPTAVIGLWTFDGHEGRAEVPAGPLADQVNGQPRSAALAAALDKQYSSGGGAVSFTTLRMIYQEMLANYRAGQENSILVITAGPHTDQSLDGPGLQDFIKNSADPAKPIAVNVIDFGGDPDRATWEAVARLSGGNYQNLPTSAGPDLGTAVSNFLS
ncbi:substrate-binding domain-containing protein [Mycobacterium paragordonae]|uniref:Substrate-binding domain-containing protein n=1 Tax=Mycobacterium paragordonae TaxID=1389713 RepID=A0AAJ1S7D7_9MYCO|nr:substrate-binding domain-containing protein [Mycobacterium paragordonae]MDP7734888.1 substrate-binding domain-containing protein [Mycobacterium paragordonae]